MASPRSVALPRTGSPLARRTAWVARRRARLPLLVFATVVLFSQLAPDALRNSISWPGYLGLAVLLLAASIVVLAVVRPSLKPANLPRFLLAFLVWIALSIAWSFYPGVSVLGSLTQWSGAVAGTAIALCLTGAELLACLSVVLRAILALSLVFEAVVALAVRHPILPFWVDYGPGPHPQSFSWSRGLLFEGGRIQGIVGNSNLLAMLALLAAIVVGAQLRDGRLRRGAGIAWLVVAALAFLLTRSSTVILAALGVAVVLVFVVWTRRVGPGARRPVYLVALVAVVVAVVGALTLRPVVLGLLGKSEDLTGRVTIWHAVTELAVQRPIVGWGWTSYWAPWVDPFRDLAVRNGTVYLQAHDAWLDVWFQVGVVGLALFAMLVVVTWFRAWFVAVDRPRSGIEAGAPFTAADAVPLLLLAALLAQSLAESRLIVEGGWLLLVVLAVRMKRAVA